MNEWNIDLLNLCIFRQTDMITTPDYPFGYILQLLVKFNHFDLSLLY